MTVQEIIDTGLTNPTRFFQPTYMAGVYVVTWDEDTLKIQAEYSGELVRELPQQLLDSAQMKFSTGYTTMKCMSTEVRPNAQGGCYYIEITLT